MMDLKQWAWMVCISSLCFSALRGLLPVKEVGTGIKLILQLYILVLLFSPAGHFTELPQISISKPVDTQVPLDLSAILLQQTQLQLQELVERELIAGAVDFTGVKVHCFIDENEVVVEKVTVYAAQEQEEKIYAAVSKALGYLPECEILQTKTDGLT